MNKKFLIAWIVVFVVWMAGSFLVHGAILGDSYAQASNLFRSQEQTEAHHSYLMLLAHVVMAGAFVWIYQRGVEPKPWLAQGVRFGVAVALLAPIPTYTIYYVVQPTPGLLSVQGAVGDSIVVIVLGIVTAALSRPASGSS